MKYEETINLKTVKIKKKTKFKKPINKKKILFNENFITIILITFILFLIFIIYSLIKKQITNEINISKNDNNNIKPKIIAITYANSLFQQQLEFNKKSALEIGKVDEHIIYGPNDIDPEYKEKNKEIISEFKDNEYCLWKPYFIYKAFKEKLREGDYIIYTDVGILYMNSTYLLIDFLKKQNAEMWMNKLNLKERLFSKRDAFIIMGVDMPFYSETYQYMGGIQIYRKSKYTEKFLEKLLFYSQDKRIILDTPNTLGFENYPGFKENMHDQTVLSLLIKKYGEANSGNPTLTPYEINNSKHILMPNIFCIYKSIEFKNFDDLKEKCIKILETQENHKIFTN